MNTHVNLDAQLFKDLYNNNKEFLIPIASIFISIILIIFFVIPQFNGYFAKQSQIQVEKDKLSKLSQSLSILSSTSGSVLDQDVQTTSLALPPDKDFASVLTSISAAASVSNISLGNFEFIIGNISGGSAQTASSPSLKISLNVTGGVPATINFIKQINDSAPISEFGSVKSSGNFSSIDIFFYYKPFTPQSALDPSSIQAISPSEQKIIDGIKIPASLSQGDFGNTSASTSSATPL